MKSTQSLQSCLAALAALVMTSGLALQSATAQNLVTALPDAFDVPELAMKPRAAITPVQNKAKIEVFRERYPNGNVHIEREVTLDTDGNYVNHGSWQMLDPSGSLIASGQYNYGKRIGTWTLSLDRNNAEILREAPFRMFKAPFTSNANFSNDKIDGDWLILDAEQRKVSQISFENGVRHGLAMTWLPSGDVLRQAEYNQGTPVGEVLQANNSTGKLERAATYLDGRRIATNVEYHTRAKRQKRIEEMYLAPKTVQKTADDFWNSKFATYDQQGEPLRHGTSKSWYTNGQLEIEGQYEYNKRVGHFRFWHPNGQISAEGDFKNNDYAGHWVWWHENGQKAITGWYDNGRSIGEWRWWDENGQLANRSTFDESDRQAEHSEESDINRTSQAPMLELRQPR
ncbi:toxin-antitoxin system YwqK family antitoxin [Aeoliella sp.]|uniref:toxin-antitoxin system YwqK family antitoxin n=1 Tax=Aeoliella sp. TaxID=2795800 RepID=UPI003CCC352C